MSGLNDQRLEHLIAIFELSAIINSSLEISLIKERAIETAVRLCGAEAGSLILRDSETRELFFEVAFGEKGEILKQVRLAPGQGIAGWVAENDEPVIIHNVRRDPRFFFGADEKSDFQTKNMICVPLKSKDNVLGVLQVINKTRGRFTQENQRMLMALSNQVAVAIENANLYTELRETFFGTAEALAETIEKRDPYTGGHTKRVMSTSISIGRRMGLSAKEIENLRLSAILHDIGKIGVRDDVLLKQGKLNDEERNEMKKHPLFGYEILSHVNRLRDVLPGVRSHHEMWDGSGYPDGLRGAEIPGAARIIAVADSFDAMTTDRPYRKALPETDAFEELRRCAGTQFAPEAVEAFFGAKGAEK